MELTPGVRVSPREPRTLPVDHPSPPVPLFPDVGYFLRLLIATKQTTPKLRGLKQPFDFLKNSVYF